MSAVPAGVVPVVRRAGLDPSFQHPAGAMCLVEESRTYLLDGIVSRPKAPGTPTVQALLRYLESVGYGGSARLVGTGVDAAGRLGDGMANPRRPMDPRPQRPPRRRPRSIAVKASEIVLRWRHPVTDDELFQLTATHGGRPTRGWWDQVRPDSLGWVTARLADGALVGFVNVAWDGGDHALLLDTRKSVSITSAAASAPPLSASPLTEPETPDANGCTSTSIDSTAASTSTPAASTAPRTPASSTSTSCNRSRRHEGANGDRSGPRSRP